ncbi:MAG TPA: thiamine phosphate synthase [Polyangiaceae bacterium]|nr:thiamine phosphate synthase [Polyangiaceae bacterium]
MTDRVVANARDTLLRFERLARAAAPGSVLLELRDRELSGRERLEFGRELKRIAVASGQRLGVNDRLDLAVLLEADSVHLGEGSVAASDARRLLGPRCFLTRACHESARELEPEVDAWILSPIFAERKGNPPLGLGVLGDFLARARTAAGTPERPGVYALGGVSAMNADQCLAAGATGVAVIGAVLGGADPTTLLGALDIAR